MGNARYARKPKELRTWNGRTYDSIKEMNWAMKFHALAAAGKIRNLREQVPFDLVPAFEKGQRAITYRADFTFEENRENIWVPVVLDVKGHKTEVYRIKKRLMRHVHGIEIEEV